MDKHSVALKEWASAVEAFLEGKTIIALRKGGIREETRDFQLAGPSFFFFPTFEHQKERLLKDEYKHYVPKTTNGWSAADNKAYVKAWAQVTDEILVEDEHRLAALSPFHIWTDDYAGERLHWKRTKPLHCLLLRVYALERPLLLENAGQYAGCKSWVEIPVAGNNTRNIPVLSDESYEKLATAVKSAVSRQ